MEAVWPPVSATKWVSRRTLDSQANNRDHSAAQPQPRGSISDSNSNNADQQHQYTHQHQHQHPSQGHQHGGERRKYGHSKNSAGAAVGRGSNGGGCNGAAATVASNNTAAPHHSNGGSSGSGASGGGNGNGNGNRFGIASGGANSGSWGNVAPNSGTGSSSSSGKPPHPGNGYGANSINAQAPHRSNSGGNHHHHNKHAGSGSGHGSGNSNGRRGGAEPAEPAMPPPPRSVQMGQGTLSAQAAAATARDFIPQPRHAKLHGGSVGYSAKPPAQSPPPTTTTALATPPTAARRWGANSTPVPRSANGGAGVAASGVTPVSAAAPATTHMDARAGLLQPESATSPSPPPFGKSLSARGAAGRVAVATVPTSSTAAAAAAGTGLAEALPAGGGGDGTRGGGGVAAAAAARVLGTTASAEPTLLDPFHLGDNLSFATSAFGGSLHSQPSEIETLLGHVERSAATRPLVAPGGSLRERRSMTDWGIEEAIRTVLPGMDEDDNSDDTHGPNLLSAGLAAVGGDWHTSGDLDAPSAVGGFLTDFPASFAASFAEQASAPLASPFTADSAATTAAVATTTTTTTSHAMDNLSRAFSTAARVDSSSFTTSPATTAAATPLQRPPMSPGVRLPHRATPVEAMSMPPSTREVARQGSCSYTSLSVAQPPPQSMPPPLPRSSKSESSVRMEELVPGAASVGGGGGSSDLLSLYTRSPPTTTSPWLSSGIGDGGVVRQTGHRSPRAVMGRPEVLQAVSMKDGSAHSNGGLTAAGGSVTSPATVAARRSTTSSHGGSAPNTPSLRKELSTPMSGSRSQPYTPGGSRPQRPSLSAPLVNRDTIAHIFRETPQSLRRKEQMEYNREHSEAALCRSPGWPPHTEGDVEQLLRDRNATKLLRHLTIISFSRQQVTGVQDLFDTWAKNGIPAPDMGFGAYYFYVKEKSEKLLCMKHNGRGASPGHGYGRCDFESRRPYSTCRYEHVCLFCRSKEHGWFEEGKCLGYQQLLAEMEDLGVSEEDVTTLLNAMEVAARPEWGR
ncbi:hypothetical protein NESM_000584500 [Novymonas esmeraldas]|uniref:Uncharacterized protein n=1 Tax=Novymonas esmeraldas TaxID=1808958 RepID=A0AAW0ERX8_9TRYP